MNIFKISLIVYNICEYLTIPEKILFAYICKYKGNKISPKIFIGGKSDFHMACINREYGRIRYFVHIKKYNMKYIFRYGLREFMDYSYSRAVVAGNVQLANNYYKKYYYYLGKAGTDIDCGRPEYLAGLCSAGLKELFLSKISLLEYMGTISLNIILESAYKYGDNDIINIVDKYTDNIAYKLLGLYRGNHIEKFNKLVIGNHFPMYLFSLVGKRVNKKYIDYLLMQNINNTDILILISKCCDLKYFIEIADKCKNIDWREVFIHSLLQNGNLPIIEYIYLKLSSVPAISESLIKDFIYDVEIIEFLKKNGLI